MFLFLVVLAVSELISVFAFSFWLAPVLLLGIALNKKANNISDAIALPLMVLISIWQLCYWTMWAACCALIASHFVLTTETSRGWIYHLLALFSSLVPLGYLTNAENNANGVQLGEAGATKGGILYSMFTVAVFVVFWIWPQLINLPLWWLK